MKTYMATPSTIERKWFIVDAADKTLGRMAAEVAKVLRGKHKPTFTPHMDTGDHVIIINAEKIHLTGKKLVQKIYFRHSGYLGGATYTKAGELLAKNPVKMVELAVRGMIPRNRLGSQIYTKLHVYAGSEHPHEAQKPEVLEIDIR